MNTKLIAGMLLTGSALFLSSCDEGGGGGNTQFREVDQTLTLEFDLDTAVALVANEDIVTEERSLGGGLPTFRAIGGSASRMGVSTRSMLSRVGDQTQASDVAGTNLLALDDQGVLSPALMTNFPLKVMYSVASPLGDKIYIALDPGWWSNEPQVDENGNWIDFSRVIAESNCALFEVDVNTNEFSCVSEGMFVQQMDDSYMKAVSGNQKPIQFDAAGNLYFAGTTFTVQEDSWDNCFFDESIQEEVCETITNSWLNQTNWQPRIFKRLVGETNATAVTQDNEYVEFFSVLKSGELVYQSRNESDWTALLKMLQGTSIIDLTDGTGWGIDFFTVDDRNAVIFGQADWSGSGTNGLRFARPRTTFGVEKASLDTSLFGGNENSGWGNPKPRRLMVSDNGRIYGVFEGGRDTYDNNGNHTGWEQTLTVYQILPFDGVPKLELALGTNDWWYWMQNTPFQVSGDLLYYKDTVDVPYLGTSDIIVMVDLNTREHTELLMPNMSTGVGRYEIYNWRLAGKELHFSGLKKDNNTVVTGVIDTALFDPDVAESVYFELTEVASAAGASSAIKDIEVIRQVSNETDPATEPTMTFFQSMENLFSMSVDFSTTMDWDSVESNLTLVSSDGSEGFLNDGNIDMMKIWVNKTLHIIPDLDGLADSSSTTPMTPNNTYTLTAATGTADSFGNATTTDTVSAITMRPDNGWYVNSADVLLYAGRADSSWAWSTYDLTQASVPANFELLFDAKNLSWDGIELMLFDVAGAEYQRTSFRMGMNGWSWIDYVTGVDMYANLQWSWANGQSNEIFNGSWKTYRLRVFGNTVSVESKPQGALDADYITADVLSQTDLYDRTGTDYRLMFRVIQPIGLDNIVLNTLDASGNQTAAGTFSEDFTGYTVSGSTFETDLTSTYNDIY
ncbi:MAG: hypothetical protein R3227_07080 [Reinekea sp.]|jgi:hypothetical protein|nr:hypothetical protein [Reinekea sp.]